MKHNTPSTKIFEEIRNCAKRIWQDNYSNEHNYVSEKLSIINALTNIEDNVMVCYRMFDSNNQFKLRNILSSEAIEYIKDNY